LPCFHLRPINPVV